MNGISNDRNYDKWHKEKEKSEKRESERMKKVMKNREKKKSIINKEKRIFKS